MNKVKIAGVVAGAALLLPAFALAATFSNVQFQNGDVTISGQGGSTVQATFHIIVPAGQVVEYIQTDVIGDNLAPVDTSVGGNLGLQEGIYDQTVSIKLPPNTGTYTLNVQGAGTYGGIRSINGNDNVVGTGSFGSALRVVASGSTSDTVGNDGTPSWMASFLAAILAVVKPAPVTPPATTAACTSLATKMAGAQYGVTNAANGKLQGFLIGEGYSIPLLQANQAPFGYWGVQTQAALSAYKTANSCN